MRPSDTLRLHFRDIVPEDFEAIFRLQSDPAVMRFIRAAETDRQVVSERVKFWVDYQASHPGYGVWIVEERHIRQLVGYCVLRESEWQAGNDPEIGYVVAPGQWGKGFATEIAENLCRYAYAHFDADQLLAFIDPSNEASRRVLEKCGFEADGLYQMKDYEGKSLRFRRLRNNSDQ